MKERRALYSKYQPLIIIVGMPTLFESLDVIEIKRSVMIIIFAIWFKSTIISWHLLLLFTLPHRRKYLSSRDQLLQYLLHCWRLDELTYPILSRLYLLPSCLVAIPSIPASLDTLGHLWRWGGKWVSWTSSVGIWKEIVMGNRHQWQIWILNRDWRWVHQWGVPSGRDFTWRWVWRLCMNKSLLLFHFDLYVVVLFF